MSLRHTAVDPGYHTHPFDESAAQLAAWSPGDLKPTARSTAPVGWLLCDGSAVSRTAYGTLFAAIGTTYGTGDGSTTFNVPDLKGRMAVGRDSGQTEFDVLGEAGGSKTGLQSHTHVQNAHSHGTDDHNHTGTTDSENAGAGDDVMRFNAPNGDRQANVGTDMQGNTDLSHAHGIPADNVNVQQATPTNQTAGTASGNLPPYLVVNWLVKT